jgi:hypothetical protein
MISKNNTPVLKDSSKNTTSNINKTTVSNATSKNSIENTRNYVSGDSAQSSSSHQFHKKSSDERS